MNLICVAFQPTILRPHRRESGERQRRKGELTERRWRGSQGGARGACVMGWEDHRGQQFVGGNSQE